MPESALILGAGLGGLLCGSILSRHGVRVTLLEQGIQCGGALQTFVRDGVRFNTGFHSVGGLGPGEPLERIFRPLGLMSLPWERMEADECVGGGPFLRFNSGTELEDEHVREPYTQSVWTLRGGGKTLADALEADIRSHGGELFCQKKVTEISSEGCVCADGSHYRAEVTVSDIHPLVTFAMVKDHVRPSFLRRLSALRNSKGIHTVYLKLCPGAVKAFNHSIFLNGLLMIHPGRALEDGSLESLDLMSFDGGIDAIALASERIPELRGSIAGMWTSSPSTWERYTSTPGGSAYGYAKEDAADFISPRTPLPWLFLTGQNIGLHGVLGVCESALATCREILDDK